MILFTNITFNYFIRHGETFDLDKHPQVCKDFINKICFFSFVPGEKVPFFRNEIALFSWNRSAVLLFKT